MRQSAYRSNSGCSRAPPVQASLSSKDHPNEHRLMFRSIPKTNLLGKKNRFDIIRDESHSSNDEQERNGNSKLLDDFFHQNQEDSGIGYQREEFNQGDNETINMKDRRYRKDGRLEGDYMNDRIGLDSFDYDSDSRRKPERERKSSRKQSKSFQDAQVLCPTGPADSNRKYSKVTISDLHSYAVGLEKDTLAHFAETIYFGQRNIDVYVGTRSLLSERTLVFNHSVELEGNLITDQKASGRCWIFSLLNILRVLAARRFNISNFQLSQNYVAFLDHLCKASWYMELVLDNMDKKLDSRQMTQIFNQGYQDGGNFDDAIALVLEFGVVPYSIYPDSNISIHTDHMNTQINSKLRATTLEMRALYAQYVKGGVESTAAKEKVKAAVKDKTMRDIYRVLTICLGTLPTPDEKFKWEFKDKNDNFKTIESTPLEFARSIIEWGEHPYSIEDSMVLGHDPRNELYKVYAIDTEVEIPGRRRTCYLNVPIEELKKAAVKQIKRNLPVWFATDVAKAFGGSRTGLMNIDDDATNLLFQLGPPLSKADALRTGDSVPNHAMTLVGVHLDDQGIDTRWKVENSWGPHACNDGFLTMSPSFFNEYVYMVAVPKTLASKRLVRIFESGQVTVLPSWDPMG